MIRVVMTGPLPPAIGGMATVIGDLAQSSLADRVRLELFDTGKQTADGRAWWQGIQARLSLMMRWWHRLGGADPCIAHIHTCSGFTFFLDAGLLALAKLRGRPVVLHVHGARFDHFLDGLDAVPAAIARWTARRADAVVVLSEEWREQLSHRLPGARLHVVQNGIAAPALPGERRQNPETVVAFLGNLGRRKGVPELLQALARSPSRIRLRMAGGEEDPDFNRTARDMARHLGIENRVDFVGPISGPTKTAFLATADVFALPSHAEGLPMSLLEAMASGLPVIVTTVGAIPSVVRDQVDGLLVAPGDIDAIAAAMTRLAAAPEMRARMGTSARERCIAGFGLDRTVEKLTAVYDAVTQPRLPGSAAKSAGRA